MLCSWIVRINTIKVSITPKENNNQNKSKNCVETQAHSIAPKNTASSQKRAVLIFRSYYKAAVIKQYGTGLKRDTYISGNDKESRNQPTFIW